MCRRAEGHHSYISGDKTLQRCRRLEVRQHHWSAERNHRRLHYCAGMYTEALGRFVEGWNVPRPGCNG